MSTNYIFQMLVLAVICVVIGQYLAAGIFFASAILYTYIDRKMGK